MFSKEQISFLLMVLRNYKATLAQVELLAPGVDTDGATKVGAEIAIILRAELAKPEVK